MQSKVLVFLSLSLMAVGYSFCQSKKDNVSETGVKKYDIRKSEEEWKSLLSPEEFHVLREKGTEYAFSGEYNDFKKKGTFHCAGCGTALFDSKTKYDSGSGWPSFYKPVNEHAVAVEIDKSYGMVREEVLCSKCGGHLGHVFNDGPKPTGLRYCVNSVSLKFQEKD